MEPESSLPHLQVPAICPYCEPARSSPYQHIPVTEDLSYYYPSIYACVSQVVSFPDERRLTYLLSYLLIYLLTYLLTYLLLGAESFLRS